MRALMRPRRDRRRSSQCAKARTFKIGEQVSVICNRHGAGYPVGETGTVVLLMPAPRTGWLLLCHVQMDQEHGQMHATFYSDELVLAEGCRKDDDGYGK